MSILLERYYKLMKKWEDTRVTELSYNDAGELAGEFLQAHFNLVVDLKKVKDALNILETRKDLAFNSGMNDSGFDKITEKREAAKVDTNFTKSREEYQKAKNDADMLNALSTTFLTAHHFFKDIYKGRFGD
jgi:hypothetical protein